MQKLLNILPFVAALLWTSSMEAGLATEGVGLQTIRVAVPGERSQIVSVPFLKPAVARGRLQGADLAAETLRVADDSYSRLDLSRPYILSIVEGPCTGKWFQVTPDAGAPGVLKVKDNGLVGSIGELSGGEAFSIHPLFTLRELLPETDSRITAGPIDVQAAQVHFYTGSGFEKFWLSDGTITGHVGWTYAADGELKEASETAILPGTSFLVQLPEVTEVIVRRLVGVVPAFAPAVPLFSGYNFVASQLSRVARGIDFKLDEMRLIESGLKTGESNGTGDRIFQFDASGSQFGESFYHDAQEGTFLAEDPLTDPQSFTAEPGEGFIIYNSGESYLWRLQP